VWLLARRLPRVSEEPRVRRWTEPYALVFVLIGLTYLNLQKSVGAWTKAGAVPGALYGIPAEAWFNLAYVALALLIIGLLAAHRRRSIVLLSLNAPGRGQLLFLVFLWWVVVGNFERTLVSFAPQRLVTEGVIHLNAVFCSFLVLLPAGAFQPAAIEFPAALPFPTRKILAGGILAALLTTTADWGIIRALYGNQFAGQAGLHIRFGPRATATKSKPDPDKPHP